MEERKYQMVLDITESGMGDFLLDLGHREYQDAMTPQEFELFEKAAVALRDVADIYTVWEDDAMEIDLDADDDGDEELE